MHSHVLDVCLACMILISSSTTHRIPSMLHPSSDDDSHPSDEAIDLHMLEGGDNLNEADKQRSLIALKAAVEHVCNMSITDEKMLERLRNVLKQGIENSDGKVRTR